MTDKRIEDEDFLDLKSILAELADVIPSLEAKKHFVTSFKKLMSRGRVDAVGTGEYFDMETLEPSQGKSRGGIENVVVAMTPLAKAYVFGYTPSFTLEDVRSGRINFKKLHERERYRDSIEIGSDLDKRRGPRKAKGEGGAPSRAARELSADSNRDPVEETVAGHSREKRREASHTK